MLSLRLAWRNILRHKRKTVLLSSLIVLGISLLFFVNAVFEGTTTGLKKTLIGSLTGDVVLGPMVGTGLSLFGNEIPIVGSYESIPPIASHNQIIDLLKDLEYLDTYTSIVSAAAQVSIGDFRYASPVFGVDPISYFDVCNDIVLDSGEITDLSDRGVFLNHSWLVRAEEALKRPLQIGEPVTFSMYVGSSFRVRTAPLSGFFHYAAPTEALERVVLADLTTVRSLADYTLGYASSNPVSLSKDDSAFDLDSLFSEDTDIISNPKAQVVLSELEEALQDTGERDMLTLTDNGAWSFVLLKAIQGKTKALYRNMKTILDKENPEARVLSWRSAAGSSAISLFALQSFFYIGIGFIALGAILVIMNALVISVLERTREIGTMRSLGASVGFIRKLFISESLIVTLGSALLGILLGIVLTLSFQKSGVRLENSLLVSLFGGRILRLKISIQSMFLHIGLASFIGAIAWIYPVTLAVRVPPLSAINKV